MRTWTPHLAQVWVRTHSSHPCLMFHAHCCVSLWLPSTTPFTSPSLPSSLDHPVLLPARQHHLPGCGRWIPCAPPLRTLAPWPTTSLPHGERDEAGKLGTLVVGEDLAGKKWGQPRTPLWLQWRCTLEEWPLFSTSFEEYPGNWDRGPECRLLGALGCTSLYREGEFRSGSWRRWEVRFRPSAMPFKTSREAQQQRRASSKIGAWTTGKRSDIYCCNSVDAVSTLGAAFRMEEYTAVLSHDGQGGGLLRDVAKLDKREDDSMAILETSYWDVNTDAVMAPACLRARVEVASLVRPPRLARSHTRVQAPISGGTGVFDGTTQRPSARERKELQAAVMRGNWHSLSTTQSSRGRAGQRENSRDEKHALQGYARTVGSSMALSNTRKCAYGGQKPAGQ